MENQTEQTELAQMLTKLLVSLTENVKALAERVETIERDLQRLDPAIAAALGAVKKHDDTLKALTNPAPVMRKRDLN